MAQKVIWHPNMAPSFLLLQVITNEKSLKFTQIGRLLSASRASPQKNVPTTLVGIPVDIYTLTKPYFCRVDETTGPLTTVCSAIDAHCLLACSVWMGLYRAVTTGHELNIASASQLMSAVARNQTWYQQNTILPLHCLCNHFRGKHQKKIYIFYFIKDEKLNNPSIDCTIYL